MDLGNDDLVAAPAGPCVLAILDRGDNYGYKILKELREASGHELGWADGTLYPLLHRLNRLGYVEAEWRNPPRELPRRYYTITPAGKSALANQRESVRFSCPPNPPCRDSLLPAVVLGARSSTLLKQVGGACPPRHMPPSRLPWSPPRVLGFA